MTPGMTVGGNDKTPGMTVGGNDKTLGITAGAGMTRQDAGNDGGGGTWTKILLDYSEHIPYHR